MALRALLLVVTVGTSIWVAYDAPRRGLSRLWALGCLVLWIVAFPLYLIVRSDADWWLEADRPRSARRSTNRRLRGIVKRRRAIAVVLAITLPLAVWEAWELRLLIRGPYMVFVVRHPALLSIPLLAGGAAFFTHLLLKLARRGWPGRGTGKPAEPLEDTVQARAGARASAGG